jgi:hypothetical protein
MSNNLKKLKRALATQAQQRDAESFKRMIAEAEKRERLEREHPVSAGIVPLVEYREPQWNYKR